ALTVFWTSATMSSSRATSVRTNKALPPAEVISFASFSPSATRRPEMTTFAPSLAKRQDSGFADARVTSSNKDSLVFEGFHNCASMWRRPIFCQTQSLGAPALLFLSHANALELGGGSFRSAARARCRATPLVETPSGNYVQRMEWHVRDTGRD